MAPTSLTNLGTKKLKRRHMESEYTVKQGNVFLIPEIGGEGTSLKQ